MKRKLSIAQREFWPEKSMELSFVKQKSMSKGRCRHQPWAQTRLAQPGATR
jgi:hypothetical protein